MILGYICKILANIAMIHLPLETFLIMLVNASDLVHVASIIRSDTFSDLQLLLCWNTNTRKRITELHRVFTYRIFV